jgi:D-alanine-D-alanine ligase
MARRLGLVFELHGSLENGPAGLPSDADAEYEPEETIAALEAAARHAGCEPVRLGGPRDLLRAGDAARLPRVDAALNIAEGYGTRNREAWAPVLLELLGIPALGSDALSLSLSLDKAWARDVASAAGVAVAPGRSVESVGEIEKLTHSLGYPLFVKPRWEGTAKGIGARSRAADRQALEAAVSRVLEDYRQPALVESFLPGPEYTVTVVGHAPPRVLPVLQRALDPATGIGVHAVPEDERCEDPCVAGGLAADLERRLGEATLRVWDAFRLRDFARADWKLDADGHPCFLEVNPLPTFAPDGSFAILAELLGQSYEALVGQVIEDGFRRLGL